MSLFENFQYKEIEINKMKVEYFKKALVSISAISSSENQTAEDKINIGIKIIYEIFLIFFLTICNLIIC
jgi:hypothetical protein